MATREGAAKARAGEGAKTSAGASAPGDDPARVASLEARVASLEARLAEQARVRAELVHVVAHELRTPITVISGFGKLLAGESHGALNEAQRRFVSESVAACGRLDAFVEDLLAARPDDETPFPIAPGQADLHETIEGLLESLAPIVEERHMKIEASLRATRSTFAFDARRLEQVVTNLMTNALRYGRSPGTVRIATRDVVAPSDAGGETPALVVCVEDDGPGIPESDRERLFAPFVRGDDPDGRGGLGIGLALCRRIVRAHGGRIGVDESPLGGARFEFTLPVVGAAEGD